MKRGGHGGPLVQAGHCSLKKLLLHKLEQQSPHDMFHTILDAVENITDNGVHSYEYDTEKRIVCVDEGSTASYGYDHQNRRYNDRLQTP